MAKTNQANKAEEVGATIFYDANLSKLRGVEIYCFGKNDEGLDRRTKQGKPGQKKAFRRIAALAEKLMVHKVYLPDGREPNGQLAEPTSPWLEEKVGPVCLFWGVAADAVALPKNEIAAVYLATADCPTAVLKHFRDYDTYVVHGGRDALLDRQAIAEDREWQCRTGPIGEIVKHYRTNNSGPSLSGFRTFICCGIDGLNFRHSVYDRRYGHFNHRLLNYLSRRWPRTPIIVDGDGLSLHELIRTQCRDHGIGAVGQDGIDTFNNKTLWSHRRGDKERNGIMVINFVT